MKRKQTPEGALQRLVLDWLTAKHIFSLRMNSGTLINQAGRPVTFGTPGCADILAFPQQNIGGKFFTLPWFIELKSQDGKQSELQRSFECHVKSEGIEYTLARSLDDLDGLLVCFKSDALGKKDKS